MPHILFVFIDGVGLGNPDPAVNPFARFELPALSALAGGQPWTLSARDLDEDRHVFRRLDANLDLDGLPQSGTGQAALFTGVNCAQLAGRHFGPYPHSATRPVLASENLFLKVQRLLPAHPGPAAFANAYPPRFFSYVERSDRWTVTTRCCLEAKIPIRGLDELSRGEAIAADLTGHGFHRLQLNTLEPRTEDESAVLLHQLSRRHALTLFEYFLTDKAGHSRSFARAEETLYSLDRFFSALLASLDPAIDLLVVTSDHGNLEDLSTKSHTRQPVPLVALGHGAHHFSHAHSILDVTPALEQCVSATQPAPDASGDP